MNLRLTYILILSLFFSEGFSQLRDDAINLQTEYLIKDSLIEFKVAVFNGGVDNIGLYTKDQFDYGDKIQWPNCFFIQKKINGTFYNIYPEGTVQNAYSLEVSYIKKGQCQIFKINFPIRQIFSPFESGSYSITFKVNFLKKRKERTIESQTLYFTID